MKKVKILSLLALLSSTFAQAAIYDDNLLGLVTNIKSYDKAFSSQIKNTYGQGREMFMDEVRVILPKLDEASFMSKQNYQNSLCSFLPDERDQANCTSALEFGRVEMEVQIVLEVGEADMGDASASVVSQEELVGQAFKDQFSNTLQIIEGAHEDTAVVLFKEENLKLEEGYTYIQAVDKYGKVICGILANVNSETRKIEKELTAEELSCFEKSVALMVNISSVDTESADLKNYGLVTSAIESVNRELRATPAGADIIAGISSSIVSNGKLDRDIYNFEILANVKDENYVEYKLANINKLDSKVLHVIRLCDWSEKGFIGSEGWQDFIDYIFQTEASFFGVPADYYSKLYETFLFHKKVNPEISEAYQAFLSGKISEDQVWNWDYEESNAYMLCNGIYEPDWWWIPK